MCEACYPCAPTCFKTLPHPAQIPDTTELRATLTQVHQLEITPGLLFGMTEKQERGKRLYGDRATRHSASLTVFFLASNDSRLGNLLKLT